MEPEKIDFVEENPTVFKAKCFSCKTKEVYETDNGMEINMPYAYVEIPEDKELLIECADYVVESQEKYNNTRTIKKQLNCPKCGHKISFACADYVSFYNKEKEEEKVEK